MTERKFEILSNDNGTLFVVYDMNTRKFVSLSKCFISISDVLQVAMENNNLCLDNNTDIKALLHQLVTRWYEINSTDIEQYQFTDG